MNTKNWKTEQQDAVTGALSSVEGLKPMKGNGTYRTIEQSAMSAAQAILWNENFWLVEVEMVEGAF